MWENLIVAAIVVLLWPLGRFACGLVCYGMGIANIPGFLLWKSRLNPPGFATALSVADQIDLVKSRLTHPGATGRFGLFLGCVGQTAVSMAFCAVLIALARWVPTTLHVSYLLIWALWAMAFLTALRPILAVMRQSGQSDPALVFARLTSGFTLAGTAAGFIVLALAMN